MVIIDAEGCIGCGLCVKVCHNRCVTLVDAVAHIDDALCDRCTQCIAVCPQRALSWDGVPPAHRDMTRLPSAEGLDELFKQRRSMRFFKADKIDRPLLQEIVDYGIYAPTNNHALRAIVVADAATIERLEQTVIRFNRRTYRLFFKPKPVYALLRWIMPAVNDQVKAKLEERRDERFRPAVMVTIVGDRRIAFSEASAQAALDLMTLYAQVKGIGSCLWGAGQIVLDRNRGIRKRLGLGRREHILGILLLGYPAVKFVNKVEGRTMPVQWV